MEITEKRLDEILSRVSSSSIIVIGDIMLDEYLIGTVDRISPEAPVPVVDLQQQSFRLGGAANVAFNLSTLGVKVLLIGVIGDDTSGKILKNELIKKGISPDYIAIDKDRHTTRKTRVIAHNQQVVRIDRETRDPISEKIETMIIEIFKKTVNKVDGIIISDYFKGVITERVVKEIVEVGKAEGKFIGVDPKEKHFSYFRGVSIITPNQKEAGVIVGRKLVSDDDVFAAGIRILEVIQSNAVLITRGERGMTLFERDGSVTHFPAVAREVYDVTGAGDTVISVLTAAYVAGASLKEAALISNYAAGIVVGELGTAAVTREKLKEAIIN